jgi:UPF0755 protein
MKKKSKIIVLTVLLCVAFVLVIVGGIVCFKVGSPAFNIDKTANIYVDEKKDYNDLLSQLKSTACIKDVNLFKRLASFLKYPENIKTGRYEITPKTTYLGVVRMLRNGQQTPVKLTFNNIRLKKDFVEVIGNQLMFDSGILLNRLNDSNVAASFGFDTITIMTMFIPNTYQIYWNIPVDKFMERMKKEYDRFWSGKRLAKAETISLSPVEVSILASIVEEETISTQEFPIVAGLYLNRLKKRMLLQADPTVKFAVGDFTLKRILNQHLQVESPYNTYKNQGLPPGPIRLPSITSIDGVLNCKEHSYIYMCAKEDFSGTHNFAVTLSEHNRNAQKYRAALNRNHIIR